MSILRSLILELAAASKAKLTQQGRNSVNGGYNSINFVETTELSDTPVKLAVSKNLSVVNKQQTAATKCEIEMAIAAQELLIKEGVDTRFLQTFLTLDDSGERISIQASEGSLSDYIRAHQNLLTREQIKRIFAQVVLGVEALHSKNLVHRDLKTANVLVTLKDGQLFLVVSDLDTVTQVKLNGTILDEENFVMMGGSTASPEIRQFISNNTWLTSAPYRDLYKKIDLKADDCYSLGVILEKLINAAAPGQFPENDPARDLAQGLLHRSSEARHTVKNILSNDFFRGVNKLGPTYFQELHDEPSPFEYIGAERARAYRKKDPYPHIQKNIKPIYALAEQLDEKFAAFDVLDSQIAEDVDAENKIVMARPSLDSLNQCYIQFNEKIIADIANLNFTPLQRELLSLLKNKAAEKMALIKAKYDITIPLWKTECAHCIEQAKYELKRKNIISSKLLEKIINYSIDEHRDTHAIHRSKSQKIARNLFGQKTHANYLEDNNAISDFRLLITESVGADESPIQILEHVCTFLNSEVGGVLKQAFKKSLTANIYRIAYLSPKELREKLEDCQEINAQTAAEHAKKMVIELADNSKDSFLNFVRTSVNEYFNTNEENKNEDTSRATQLNVTLYAVAENETGSFRKLTNLVAGIISKPIYSSNGSDLCAILRRNLAEPIAVLKKLNAEVYHP